MKNKKSSDGGIHIRISHSKCWDTHNFQLLLKYLAVMKNTWEFDAAGGTSLGKSTQLFNAWEQSREGVLPGFSKSSRAGAQCAAGSQWPKKDSGACRTTVDFKHWLHPEASPWFSARSH